MTNKYIKKIIDHIAKNKIKIIKFTGGEPLLREDIFELMEYAKNKNLEVRLNTNASLINNKIIAKLVNIVDDILIPIESYDPFKEDKITEQKNSLLKKIRAIKELKLAGVKKVRIGTVATKENIKNYSKLFKLINNLPVDEWEFYRPISTKKYKSNITGSDIENLVNKILNSKKNTKKYISIANAIPFCAVSKPHRLSSVSSGALFDDGHNRLVIDPGGYVKPHYFLDENIGDPLNIIKAWNSEFLQKIKNYASNNIYCKKCRFNFKCKAGSRHEAKITNNNYFSEDPLINYKNIK